MCVQSDILLSLSRTRVWLRIHAAAFISFSVGQGLCECCSAFATNCDTLCILSSAQAVTQHLSITSACTLEWQDSPPQGVLRQHCQAGCPLGRKPINKKDTKTCCTEAHVTSTYAADKCQE